MAEKIGHRSSLPFFYLSDNGVLVKRNLDEHLSRYFMATVLKSLKPATSSEYWKGPARCLLLGSAQSYIYYSEKSYWLVDGICVVEMSTSGFRMCDWMEQDGALDDAGVPASYRLIFDSWDCRLSGDFDSWIKCSDSERSQIDSIAQFAKAVHQGFGGDEVLSKLAGEM